MMDFWEIMGRAATITNFRNALFAGPYYPPYPVGGNSRAAIPQGDYTTAVTAIRNAGMVNRPLSLMAVGEILYSMSVANFNNQVVALFNAIQASGVPINPVDDNFYVGLGVMTVDAPLRTILMNPATNWGDYGLSGVQPADKATLQALFDPNLNVAQAADGVCLVRWGNECFVKLLFWPVNHTHPVV